MDKTNNLNTINRLFEWDAKRKEKIKQKRIKKIEKIEENKHIPKINKRSASMVELKKSKSNARNIFDKLAKLDSVALQKKKILLELYTPSFKPNINTKKKLRHKENNKGKNQNFEKYEIEKEEEENEEIEENEELEDNSKNKETVGRTKLANQYLNVEDLQQLYRNVLFKKKIKSKNSE